MKILISTFFLTIVIFLNFSELNAEENDTLNLKRKRGRPAGQLSRRVDGHIIGKFRINPNYRKPIYVKEKSDDFLDYMGHKIEVWLDDSKTRILKANYPENHRPTGRDYATTTFLVRLGTISGSLKIVEYIKPDGTLIGVRAPRPTTANVMEPNSRQCFIVYYGKYFRVTYDPPSITLANEEEADNVSSRKGEIVNFDGFEFLVLRGIPPKEEVTGAQLIGSPTILLDHNIITSNSMKINLNAIQTKNI
ncbi:uncharacterized protein LOC117169699 [Belonocnema kinseyi]|uniref:uncharacterized protein LOC117169699 n=1 Tax=Belonocnema kinseyi TaxID=2817044 RepID=UPI00143D0174|nr:uncharacterized protein LOC117169699 [Belonocnema kinseyi]